MGPRKKRGAEMSSDPAVRQCPQCGATPPPGALCCPECGRRFAPAQQEIVWTASIPLLTNRFILYDLGKVLGLTMVIVSLLMLVILAVSVSGRTLWSDYWSFLEIFALVVAGLAVMFLAVMLVFFGNRFVMRFRISADGIGWETRMRRAHWSSRAAVVAGTLRGKPGVAGAGLIGASQESGTIGWHHVRRVRLHPELCTVSVMNRWRVLIRLFCSPENYQSVVEALRRRIPEAALRALALVCVAGVLAGGLAAQNLAPAKPVGSGFNFFSERDEKALGRRYAEELNKKLHLVSEPQVRGYVERIGRRLEQASPRPGVACEYQVVNTREVNAFAVPGGFIYVNRGLIDLAQSEDEVAAVVAHEIGHVIGRHATRQISKQLLLQGILLGAVTAANAKSKKWADIAAVAGGIGTMLAALKYSRNDEYQADALALQMLQGAGYSPGGLVSFFDRMDNSARRGSGAWNWLAVVSTHPPTRERIRRAELALATGATDPPAQPGEQFASVKQTLAAIPLPPAGRDVSLSSALRQVGLAEATAAGHSSGACPENAPAAVERVFRVKGDTVWLDAGISLREGDFVEIEASGEIRPIKKSELAAGPDGLPGTTGGFWKPISSAETGALLGRLEQGESRKDFVAGSSASFCVPFQGKLKLGINDSNPFDNRGEFQVSVTVRRTARP
ncbi:MAG: M48 family metalloprotease [Bryobacteraceae bacterium]|nr:M48 family metalloprotease [Bryobacteraceae bacterium]